MLCLHWRAEGYGISRIGSGRIDQRRHWNAKYWYKKVENSEKLSEIGQYFKG